MGSGVGQLEEMSFLERIEEFDASTRSILSEILNPLMSGDGKTQAWSLPSPGIYRPRVRITRWRVVVEIRIQNVSELTGRVVESGQQESKQQRSGHGFPRTVHRHR